MRITMELFSSQFDGAKFSLPLFIEGLFSQGVKY